jgi:glutamate formiminotransferase / formiminotetrahydrofolate cyclodeaminase
MQVSKEAIIECVPNFSEGRNKEVIQKIAYSISATTGVKLLHIDPGYDANRTVMTFIGHPQEVIKAAFNAIKTAAENIDMSTHKGTHPRMGATDVCPLIPIQNITIDEVDFYAKELAKMVGDLLQIPVYLYEKSSISNHRKRLEQIRKGAYEGLENKMKSPEWYPDFGPLIFNKKNGATVIGARKILIAYNVNLDTKDVHIAQKIAEAIRESGLTIINEKNEKIKNPGKLKSVKAIGWYIKDFDTVQVSMNLTDTDICSIHQAYEACVEEAQALGVKVTGSELIGLIPINIMISAGKYFANKKNIQTTTDEETITLAIQMMGLNELNNFNVEERLLRV